MQECGETRDAIIEDDEKRIAEILYANAHKDEPYWIVIFAKPYKGRVDGKYALVKVIKAYDTKPMDQVGMVVGEVNNKKGTISWTVNQPQVPFDWDALPGEKREEFVVETSTIPQAYITR